MARSRRKAAGGAALEAQRQPSRAPRRAEAEQTGSRASEAAASRATTLIWIGLAILALARVALAFVPSMWAWSLNLQRFLAPAWAWGTWAVLAASLVPAVARRAERALAGAGTALADRPGLAATFAAVVGAVLCFAFPDRVRFTGDFLIRQGTVETAILPQRVWPQAMPLDALLHFTLPLELTRLSVADANGAARWIGALEAAALGVLAVAFARTLRLRGAAFWAAGGILFGGYLGLFTGYGKAFTEMTVLAAAVGVAGLVAVRTGGALVPLAVSFAIALAVHRSAIGFLPAVALAGALAIRRRGGAPALRERSVQIALGLTAIALVALLPRIVHLIRTVDPVHFASAEVAAGGGLLKSAFGGVRLSDAVNVLLLLAPLAPVVPLALIGFGRDLPRGREALFLAALALPFALSIPFVHALGGLFRDVDDFAAAGMAVALLAAWLLGETLRSAPGRGLAAAALCAAFIPTLQWLVLGADLERGIRRVEAIMSEPPPRTEAEHARTWDYLGARWNGLERWEESARAFENAARAAPSPRMLQQWAIAEELRGNLSGSLAVYKRLVEKDSTNLSAWSGMAQVASRIPDRVQMRRALTHVLALDPSDTRAASFLKALDAEAATPR